MSQVHRLVLGLVPHGRTRERVERTRIFMRALGERTGVYVVERNVASYDELEREITLARIDIAWLPPMVFARLERSSVVVALATRSRLRNEYTSVLLSARGSGRTTLDHLQGARVAWVDPLSASGYVVPRLRLQAQGIDPRATFAQETFTGSHAESVRSLLEGHADLAATYANLDEAGHVGHGVWNEIGACADDFHFVATLGDIPPDVIAARTSVPEETRDAILHAFLAMTREPELGDAIEGVFGGRDFERGTSRSYDALRDLLARAANAALDGDGDAFSSTTPPAREP